MGSGQTIEGPAPAVKGLWAGRPGADEGGMQPGLELVAAREAYEPLPALRGKVNFSIDRKELREGRG